MPDRFSKKITIVGPNKPATGTKWESREDYESERVAPVRERLGEECPEAANRPDGRCCLGINTTKFVYRSPRLNRPPEVEVEASGNVLCASAIPTINKVSRTLPDISSGDQINAISSITIIRS